MPPTTFASPPPCRTPRPRLALSNRAAAFLRLNEPGEAARACEAALRGDPRHAKSLFRLGRAREAEGRFAEAAAAYALLQSGRPALREAAEGLRRTQCGAAQAPVDAAHAGVVDAAGAGAGTKTRFRIPDPAPFFVGRAGELALVTAAVRGGGQAVVTVTGVAGVGKTQTVQQWVREHDAEFDHVAWLIAKSEGRLVAELVALGTCGPRA